MNGLTNENENTITQNLWDAAKELLRGKIIAIKASRNKKNLKQSHLTPKELENEEIKKPKGSIK